MADTTVVTVRVNELQLDLYKWLRSHAQTVTTNAKTGAVARVVSEDVLMTRKQNVVNALIHAGAIAPFRAKHVRILEDVSVELLVRKPNIRTLRKLEQEQIAA